MHDRMNAVLEAGVDVTVPANLLIGFVGQAGRWRSLSPVGGLAIFYVTVPTPCAVGCILSPACGSVRHDFAAGVSFGGCAGFGGRNLLENDLQRWLFVVMLGVLRLRGFCAARRINFGRDDIALAAVQGWQIDRRSSWQIAWGWEFRESCFTQPSDGLTRCARWCGCIGCLPYVRSSRASCGRACRF